MNHCLRYVTSNNVPQRYYIFDLALVFRCIVSKYKYELNEGRDIAERSIQAFPYFLRQHCGFEPKKTF